MVYGEGGGFHVFGSIAAGQLLQRYGLWCPVDWRGMEINKGHREADLAIELVLQAVKLYHKYWSSLRC